MTELDTTKDLVQTPPSVQYATFNSRIFASALDIMVIMFVAIPVNHWIISLVMTPIDPNELAPLLHDQKTMPDFKKFMEGFLILIQQKNFMKQVILENTLDLLFIAAYTIPFWFRYSATPGKLLLRLQIQDINTHTPMTRKQSILRFICYIVSFLPCSFGFLWIVFNKKRRGFHDILSNTVVIVKPRKKGSLFAKKETPETTHS